MAAQSIQWPTIAGVLTAAGTVGAFAVWVWRGVIRALTRWKDGDAGLKAEMVEYVDESVAAVERRLSDLGANTLREIEAIHMNANQHDAKDDKRFAEVYGRFNQLTDTMARRDDMARIENKIDQLLLQGKN